MANKKTNTLGKVIIVRLYEMGKTQRWLAEQCGVTPTSISCIVNGTRKPSKRLSYGIAQNLNVPYDEILSIINGSGDLL